MVERKMGESDGGSGESAEPAKAKPRLAWDQRLARWMVRPLVHTPVTPNHITTVRLLLGLAACGLFAMGTRPEILYAAGLFMLSNFVDHMDGELARLSGKSSRFGYHYDNYSDAFIHVTLFVCIGIGLQDSWIGSWAPYLGLIAGVSVSALFLMFWRIEQRAGTRQARQPMFKGIHLEDAMYFIGPITWGGGLIVLLLAGVALPPHLRGLARLEGARVSVRQAAGGPVMTTLVTGATGFLGSAVARALLDAGHAVRVLTRQGADTRNIDGLDVEQAIGDFNDRASLEQAARRAATRSSTWRPTIGSGFPTHLRSTAPTWTVPATCCAPLPQRGAARIVYTSSVATLGLNADHSPADEETPVTEAAMIGHYKRSKYLAEEAVRALVREEGVPAVIVNPSAPIGPRDIKPTPTGRIIVDFATGRMPAYVDTGLNVVHVDDCAAGHLQALARGAVGERYILGGEDMTLREILECLARLTGRPAPRIRLSHRLLAPVAAAGEAWARVAGGEPRLTRDSLRMARKMMFFSSAKAERELGYTARPAEEALADALRWFQANGYV